MPSLYELSDEYALLMDELENASTEDEVSRIMEYLGTIEGDMADKAEAYARILRNKIADAAVYKAEKQRLEKLQKSAESAVEWLKDMMLKAMQNLDVNEVHTSIGKWRIQQNPASVQIVDESIIPDVYKIPQPVKIDKSAILMDYRDTGIAPQGVDIIRTTGIRFR